MSEGPSAPSSLRLRKRLLYLVPIMMLLIGGITYFVIQDAQHKIVEFQAVNVAEIVARQAAAGRTVYARDVATKLARDGTGPHVDSQENKGFVPIPAQFLKLVGREASATSDNLYGYKPVSKWNLEPSQGLSTEFQKWAWRQLEAQDQADPRAPIAWKPVWRFDDVQGVKTLFYLRADPAAAESCVSCHNAMEHEPRIIARRVASGVPSSKQWKLHQLLGAIQVEIPLERVGVIVAAQTRQTLFWIMAVLAVGLVIAVWFVFSDLARARRITQLSWLVTHDPASGLFNSRALIPMLERVLADARANARPHALCHLHVSGLEAAAGAQPTDQMLKAVADQIRKVVRSNVAIVRLHGFHFALLLPGYSRTRAEQVAASVLRSIRALPGHPPANGLRASIGVVMVRSQSEGAESLLKAAENACLAAEAAGPNTLRVA
jgi:diguanylate cyclase (GGDEF)-like protein